MTLRFRPAGLDDADQLLRWRNHPACRNQSLISDVIDFETHLGWLTQALVNPRIFICLAEFNSQPVGYIRVTRESDNRIFLSWLIAPEHQGQGFGKELVNRLCYLTTSNLFARIKTANTASVKVAQYAGFACVATQAEYDIWQFIPATREHTMPAAAPWPGHLVVETPQLVECLNCQSGSLRLFY